MNTVKVDMHNMTLYDTGILNIFINTYLVRLWMKLLSVLLQHFCLFPNFAAFITQVLKKIRLLNTYFRNADLIPTVVSGP